MFVRGGAKSVPQKNIYPVLRRPLIAYTIEPARLARSIKQPVITMEDPEIARGLRAEMPFLRWPDLAEDGTPDYPVV